jgi:hypothetical protein
MASQCAITLCCHTVWRSLGACACWCCREYVLLSGLTPQQFKRVYPGGPSGCWLAGWMDGQCHLGGLPAFAHLPLAICSRHMCCCCCCCCPWLLPGAAAAVVDKHAGATVAAAGRRLLMDLGSAAFNSSLGWFLERYGALGVEFDEIWAWEVKAQEPQQYWKHVPSRVKSRMHVSGRARSTCSAGPHVAAPLARSLCRPSPGCNAGRHTSGRAGAPFQHGGFAVCLDCAAATGAAGRCCSFTTSVSLATPVAWTTQSTLSRTMSCLGIFW